MKIKRLQFKYRSNASKLHRKVGDILRDSKIFQNYKIYQEYPVSKINKTVTNNKLKYDWVVQDLHLVIECHGKQHYEPTSFGTDSGDKTTLEKFKEIQERDRFKKEMCEEAGWTYIAIKYDEVKKMDDDLIFERYKENLNSSRIQTKQIKQQAFSYDKEKAKAYRKKQYQNKKEWLKKWKEDNAYK